MVQQAAAAGTAFSGASIGPVPIEFILFGIVLAGVALFHKHTMPIAVTGAKRSSAAPDIPAIGEFFPGYNVQSLNGVVVPSGTPREAVRRLNADFLKAMQLPEMKTRMAEFGLQPVGNTPEQFDALIRSEIEKWAKVARAANIKVD